MNSSLPQDRFEAIDILKVKAAVQDRKIDPREYSPLARSGGRVYFKMGDLDKA